MVLTFIFCKPEFLAPFFEDIKPSVQISYLNESYISLVHYY